MNPMLPRVCVLVLGVVCVDKQCVALAVFVSGAELDVNVIIESAAAPPLILSIEVMKLSSLSCSSFSLGFFMSWLLNGDYKMFWVLVLNYNIIKILAKLGYFRYLNHY